MKLDFKTFSDAEIKAADEGIVEGYASTYDIDSDGDRILPGAYELHSRVKGLWQHNWDEPIGIPDLVTDDKGLFVSMRLLTNAVARAREAHAMAKEGLIDAFSIGYRANEWSYDDSGVRNIKSLKVYEVSLVTFPANAAALVTNVKSVPSMQEWPLAPRNAPWDSSAAIKRIRDKLQAGDTPTPDYKRCFLWYDADSQDNFGAYKLPYCDVVGGEIKAIPRAIFAAAAAVEGARGGVEIPVNDKKRVRGIISRWYEKMAEMWDDDSLVAPWDRSKGFFPTFEEVDAVYGERYRKELETALTIQRLTTVMKNL